MLAKNQRKANIEASDATWWWWAKAFLSIICEAVLCTGFDITFHQMNGNCFTINPTVLECLYLCIYNQHKDIYFINIV